MIDVDVIGFEDLSDGPSAVEVTQLCALALGSAAIDAGHLAVELVDSERIRELNASHRGLDGPTDVLSFPIDGADAAAGPRELGDVVICAEHTEDLREAVLHGVLH
ncbi:MAG: rRNA maturation RNase YbeY, partial [Solirubrobacteraceae bacterium]